MRLIGEAREVKLFEQEIPGAVPREHSPRAVGAMRGGREADQNKIGFGIAKRRYGTPPIGPVAIRAALGARDLLAIVHQARALAAIRDLTLQYGEPVLRR